MKRLNRACRGLLLAVLQGMERSTPFQRVVVGIVIALFFAAALYLRIAFSHDAVFGGEWVKFTGVDAYWHARIIDNLAHNFPHFGMFDPYLRYPVGGDFGYLGSLTSRQFPFFDYLVAGIVWIIGLGSPTQHTVDAVAPYFPPVMAALTIIPVYFIGKTLFSRWAGVIAAGLVAILPGEFLGRSILGFTDHHVAETLFSTTAVMFLLLALKNAKKEPITWSQLRHPKGTGLIKPVVYSLCGGVFLGIYLASWMGALLFVMIIAGFLLVQFCIEHVGKKPTDYLCLVGVPTFLSALLVFLLFSQHRNTVAVLSFALFLPIAMIAVSRLMARGRLKPAYYLVTVVGLGLAAFFILKAAAPSLVEAMLDNFDIFRWNKGTTISEAVPLLFQRSSTGVLEFSLSPLWHVYGFSMLFGIVGLGMLGYAVIKRWEPEKVLFIIWILVILLATLGQRRFNYYLVVNVALLTGYVSWGVLRFVGLKALAGAQDVDSRYRKKLQAAKRKREHQRESYRLRPSHAYVALTTAGILLLFSIIPYSKVDLYGTGKAKLVSTVDYAKATADLDPAQPRYAPPDAWCESLAWLREETPEPFGDAGFYYARYDAPFDYSAYPDVYSVMAWWDYGYWIVRIGHRPPCQNPAGVIPAVAEFFVAQDESDAERIMDERGARYVILDADFASGKFYGAVSVTGRSLGDFYDYFVEQVEDDQGNTSYRGGYYYFPEYYQSMTVRLYYFGGKAVTPRPGDCQVISWKWEEIGGVRYKSLTSRRSFDTYAEAMAFIDTQSSGNYQIVSGSPLVSPVPLGELEGFVLCHDSDIKPSGTTISQVRIFEYVK